MKPKRISISDLKFYPLTPSRWKDFEELFGDRGACGGCWCMWWKLKRSQFEKQKGKKNKLAMKKMVNSGKVPGILAYVENKPIAWCSVGPRESYPALERSRLLKRIVEDPVRGGVEDPIRGGNSEPVWSVVCFFVKKSEREKGVSTKILQAAVNYAKRKGAKIVEGYPLQPKKTRWADAFIWTGHLSAFLKVGFKQIHRPSPTRAIVRYFTEKKN